MWIEAEQGRKTQKLVSVLIEDVSIPIDFSRIQAAKLLNWNGAEKDEQLEAVLEGIRLKVTPGNPPPQDEVRQFRAQETGKSKRISMIAGVAVALLAVLGAYLWLRPSSGKSDLPAASDSTALSNPTDSGSLPKACILWAYAGYADE